MITGIAFVAKHHTGILICIVAHLAEVVRPNDGQFGMNRQIEIRQMARQAVVSVLREGAAVFAINCRNN